MFPEIHEKVRLVAGQEQLMEGPQNELEELQLQMLLFLPLSKVSPSPSLPKKMHKCLRRKVFEGTNHLGLLPSSRGGGIYLRAMPVGHSCLVYNKHVHKNPFLKTFLNNRYVFPTSAMLIHAVA